MFETQLKVFTGNANPQLATQITNYLEIPLGKAKVERFSDGEVNVNIEESVRGYHTYVLQPHAAPANESIMEMLVMIDALKRASASEITAVVPYYAYARQDRKVAPRQPITAKLIADLLEAAGATRMISMDLHASQIQGFFNVPVDNLYATPVFLEDIESRFFKDDAKDIVLVSPDAGGVERARAYAKRLHCSLAIIDKRRKAPGVAEVMNIIGDVKGMRAIIIDDMIDTAGTLCKAAEALTSQGATGVWSYATHAVFSGAAIENIKASSLDEVVVTNTLPLTETAQKCGKIRTISCAPLVGEAMRRIYTKRSISSLFFIGLVLFYSDWL